MSVADQTIGKRRRIGLQILVSIVTFGLYGVYWAYISHEEVKQYSTEGVGGVLGAVIYVLAALGDFWASKGAPEPAGI